MSLGFIILRNVICEKTNKYWIECYKCIRIFYPKNKILIIDDNSNYEFVTTIQLENTIIIKSEYTKRGEILPYYYYLQNKLFERAVILHDSVFIQKYIDFEADLENKFLWSFLHKWDDSNNEKKLIHHLNDNTTLLSFHDKKKKWHGCFGCMSVISHDFLTIINKKYNIISNLIDKIQCRNDRMHFERIFALVFTYENELTNSVFGDIHEYIKNNNFGYTWGYDYNNYSYIKTQMVESHDLIPLHIIKIWSGR